ncbi:MAG TPA: abhydrolase domain-containing 18 [Terriglobia bacterium]|nr:abhydrolase domain-containing 18 [Terriglobia bacterium]
MSGTAWIYKARQRLNSRYRAWMDAWESRLVSTATNRVVRPFEWGLEWSAAWPCAKRFPRNGHEPEAYLSLLSSAAVERSDEFYGYTPPTDFQLSRNLLRFTSPVATPYPENNVVQARWFPARNRNRKAVLVLPHWNAKEHEHTGLCQALQLMGLSTLRLSLPYHDRRMPPELERADYAVSANVARTIDATRQAVVDIRSCLDWLESQGYRKIGIVGTSLGSCYAFLASAHDARLTANVYNMFSLYFADPVWTGQTTRHVRRGLEGAIDLERLRACWQAITPLNYVDAYARFPKKSLFIYANYDSTFLPAYSRAMLEQVRLRQLEHEAVVLPCGHYTMGQTPFRYVDGYYICSFLLRSL